MNSLTHLPQWQALADHFQNVSGQTIASLFEEDPNRASHFSLGVGELFVDCSKNYYSASTRSLLSDLARAVDIEAWRERMFNGELINVTESRAVLHTALRNQSDQPVYVEGEDVMPMVKAQWAKMHAFSTQVRSQKWLGYTQKPIKDIVNIGIGGSDFGPRMVVNALEAFVHPQLRFHFVANVDPAEIQSALRGLDPQTTMFIVSSKTFTTQETLTNAHAAKHWLLQALHDEQAVARHFVAVSTNLEAVDAFGIDKENCFEFWDWVGGRYSLWSTIGLPIVLAIGMDGFNALLAGAYEMDQHFRQEPIETNLPMNLALLGIWYHNFYRASTHGVFPYAYNLRDLPAYLQQADMESNGKRITRDNHPVDYSTGPIIWGNVGVNGQHAFFQLIHQGTHLIPCDFIIAVNSNQNLTDQHRVLLANFLAQTEGLFKGRTANEVIDEMQAAGINQATIDQLVDHRVFPGNKPSTAILMNQISPRSLGNLIAMYEHKIFTQGIVWNVNSYDQWGVELGKQLSRTLEAELEAKKITTKHDPSTTQLLNHIYSTTEIE